MLNQAIKIWSEKAQQLRVDKKRGYIHFDQKPNLVNVCKVVSNPQEIADHHFYPFIEKIILTPRYKKDKDSGERKKDMKERSVMYASHMDAHIYSYYNILLELAYEKKIKEEFYSKFILAYRKFKDESGKGKCNIHFAHELFEAVKEKGECVILAFDISNFYTNLDHKLLLKSWKNILGVDNLPEDHYNVFKSITRYSKVSRNILYEEFKIEDKQEKIKRFCTAEQFRDVVRKKRFIVPNKEGKGIPQGAPMSGLLSNLYMLNFDKMAYQEICEKQNGLYRRYSDDIIVVCSTHQQREIENWIKCEISNQLKLEINTDKTEVTYIKLSDDGSLRAFKDFEGNIRRNAQYLGFEFNGKNCFIRSSSLARYYRRMKMRVRMAKKRAERTTALNKIVFKKKLLIRNSDYIFKIQQGSNKASKINYLTANFVTYAQKAAKSMKEDKINKQISPHLKKLHQEVLKKIIK
ncbi:antiviral reverse transcriptase Drt2 [Larkinella sp. GY13]|uniref:antiviral reverse transcriptase Drt2 n=1 Tax=Larkinella sp. GY13 TaxID=3453720 RepID=UPI003EED36A7